MVNKLSTEQRALALHNLVEGMSIRSIERTLKISLNTIYRLHTEAGEVALAYHKKVAKNLNVRLVQCDEIWSFIYAKDRNLETATNAPNFAGSVWTWTAMDVDSRFMLTWEIGDRSTKMAHKVMRGLKKRLNGERIQLTTDGHKPYLRAVSKAFGDDIDYATLVKTFQSDGDPTIDARTITGNPDPNHINTSYIERTNLALRMGNRRHGRKTNAFSKRIEFHKCSVSLYFLYYNFCKPHGSLGDMTPAQVIGIADKSYDLEWVVGLIDKRAPKPRRPKTYNKSLEMKRKQHGTKMRAATERRRKVMS